MEAGVMVGVGIYVVWLDPVTAFTFSQVHAFSHDTFHIA